MELKINRRFNEKDLPDVQTIRDEAHKRASQIVIPETLFMKTNGVKSEAEYKKKMMAQHKVMTTPTSAGPRSTTRPRPSMRSMTRCMPRAMSSAVSAYVSTAAWACPRSTVTA